MKLEKNFRQLLSFSEEMKDRGSRPRSKVLAFKRIHPDEEVAEALHLGPAEEVFVFAARADRGFRSVVYRGRKPRGCRM